MSAQPVGLLASVAMAVSVVLCFGEGLDVRAQTSGKAFNEAAERYSRQMLREGKNTFRFDTFGSEDFWGGHLKLHQAIAGKKFGGVGEGVSPKKRSSLASRSIWMLCRRTLQRQSRPERLT